jgi:SAM-dependent methyltransferase
MDLASRRITAQHWAIDLMFLEIAEPLHSLAEWRQYCARVPQIRSQDYIESVVASVRSEGLIDPLLGPISVDKVEIKTKNYRESLIHEVNSRQRAITLLVAQFLSQHGSATKIYAPEAVTPLARLLGTVAQFQGSEYLPGADERGRFPGVMHQDVMNLSFPDQSFDLYVSCEVMEHVPDVERTLSEARRVLKRGGELIATFPFAYGSEGSLVKAALQDGQIVHFTEPEYHGNPVSNTGGSLVFTIPGWDILDSTRAAGFDTAEILAISSRRHGIVAQELATVLVLRAQASSTT